MLFSEASGRKVVSTSTAETVGKIDGFIVDPRKRAVVALTLKKTPDGNTLTWDNVAAFGSDAVTVRGVEAITDADENVANLSGKHHQLVGKRVLSARGDDLGKVTDIDFDAGSGDIVEIRLTTDRVEGVRLIGVGSYAVVVKTA